MPATPSPASAVEKSRKTASGFHWRSFTSFVLTLSGLALLASGVVLFVTPRGRTAHWSGWTLLGLEKEEWAALHINVSILFALAALLHVIFNWNVLIGYLHRKAHAGLYRKWELLTASAASAVVVAGSIWLIPPFEQVITLNDDIKDYWESVSERAPAAHAELLTIEQFSARIGLEVDTVIETLHKEGYSNVDTTTTVQEAAETKQVAPSQVFSDLKKHFPDLEFVPARPGQGRAHGPGPGGGGQGRGRGQGRGQGGGFGRGAGNR